MMRCVSVENYASAQPTPQTYPLQLFEDLLLDSHLLEILPRIGDDIVDNGAVSRGLAAANSTR